MSAVNSSARETLRPSSQPRDQLVLQVENVALSGRLLSIEIYEVQNAATSRTTSTPSSSLRPTPLPLTPLTPSRTAGFRVAARDDVANEYSLFVTRQKAEYLYRAAYPVEAAASEVISLEAMANGILGHLNIIGNRQRDVGKLVCREPEPHVEKKTRVLPATTPPEKQRNPHLPSKRQDQRAVRVQKTSKRTMEAVAKAMKRHEQDASGDDESAGSEAESGKMDRKSSEASILHRMAVADAKTMWKSELETNYEDSEHALPLYDEDDKDIDAYRIQPYTLAPGLSPVKRALPERKTKHKDLEERRQKGRQQRIRVQAAQENSPHTLGSFQAQNSYKVVVEETEQDLSGEGSRRSSMMAVSSTEKPAPQPRASSAPRSSVVVGNAYALKNLPSDTSEPEQFLRRRPSEVHRSVLKKDHWQDDIGMSIEITAERPALETPPSRLDELLGTARRVLMVTSLGASMQRSTGNLKAISEHSRTASLKLHALGPSHSAPTLQSPKIEKPICDKVANPEIASQTETGTQPHTGEEGNCEPPLAQTTDEVGGTNSESISSSTEKPEPSDNHPLDEAPVREQSCPRKSLPLPMSMENRAESQDRLRQRSNSLGSDGVVRRLAPLSDVTKPPVQEFLTPPEAEEVIIATNAIPESEVAQVQETIVPVVDPEVSIFPSDDLRPEANQEVAVETSERSDLETPQVTVPSFEDVKKEIQVSDSSCLPVVEATTPEKEETEACESTSSHQSILLGEGELVPPSSPPQACWDEQEVAIPSPVIPSGEEIEELPSDTTSPEEGTIGNDESEVHRSPANEVHDLPLEEENNNDDKERDKLSIRLQENVDHAGGTDVPVQSSENDQQSGDVDVEKSDSISSNVLDEHYEVENDAEPRGNDTTSSADLNLALTSNIDELSDVEGASDSGHETTSGSLVANDADQLGFKLQENGVCTDTDDIASVVHQQHVAVDDSINETVSTSFGIAKLDQLTHEDGSPVMSGPREDAIEPVKYLLGGEECTGTDHGQDDEINSREGHDLNHKQHSESVSVTNILSQGDQLQFLAEDEMKRQNAVEVTPNASAFEADSTASQTVPPEQTPKLAARKRSLNPSKKGSASPTEKAKAGSKVSRRTTVAEVPNEQAVAEPAPKLERRHTAEDVKRRNRARRMSTIESSDVLPDLARRNAPKTKTVVTTPAEKHSSAGLRPHDKLQVPSKRHSSQNSGIAQSVTNYHKKWGKWMAGRNIIEKVGCLQLEELVMADSRNEENLLKLGLRYARWSGTSMSGILLLEHAALLHKNATGTQEYWFWLGSAHLDIFMRHRKYLPVARFHLSKSLRAFTSAFAYIGSLADPMLLLRYAIGLFWHKGDGNLEKTRDIFLELFSQFVSFCDKDRPNLLFLQFQVCHRLKLYVEAIECMNKVIALHEGILHQPTLTGVPILTASVMAHFAVYNEGDYRLMLMQSQEASGDYVAAAQSLATVLKLKGIQQDTTLRDEQYFELWYSLAEKCFHHEDYALALDYYAIALNFAKQSQVLAAIHYNLGLCFQSLGEDNKCVTEYKRARTANRHVPPLVSLAELSAPYDERFAQLLQKTVVQTIEEVRVELYGRAVRRLQQVFRKSRRNLNINLSSESSASPQTKMPTLSKRRLSIAAARNPPALVKIEDAADESAALEEESVPAKPVAVDDYQVVGKSEDSALEVAERRHDEFLARKQAAMEEIAQLLTNPQYRGRETSSPANARLKAGAQMRSGLLSPEKDRLDVRRKQSMETYRQLGYVSTMPWIEFWEKLLALALDLFETRQALYASIARIRGRLPLVTDDVAFCALAESIGNVNEAVEKLHDATYERELTYVCAVIDVSKQLVRHFPLGPGQKTPHVSLPTISSPRPDTSGSHNSIGASTPGRTVLPPYSPSRAASASISNSKQHLRMNQMLNLHFQEHVQQQEAAIAIAEATGGFVHPQRRMEKLAVLKDFRKANDVLLTSQLAFGTEREAA